MRFTPELRFVQSRADEHLAEMDALFAIVADERRQIERKMGEAKKE
jgi:ribosome-binding factor A